MKLHVIKLLEKEVVAENKREELFEMRDCGLCGVPTKTFKAYTGNVTCDYCKRLRTEAIRVEVARRRVEEARIKQERYNNRLDVLLRKYSKPVVVKLGDILAEEPWN